jgi:membrane-associated protein
VGLIQGLHGVVALVVLLSLLFAEEAGVPLPTPGELTLIAAGVPIATGALNPWLFVPLAIACALAGSMTGYSWARLAGEHGLQAAAERLHQTRRLERVTSRLQQAGPREIALSRLMPGLRVYTTLVAGAAGVDRRRFLIGIGPLTVVWVGVFTVLGVVAGVPAARVLGQLQALILQGGLLIVIGVGGYFAIHRVPEGGREVLARLPTNLRRVLAVAVDMALIATIVSGVLGIVTGVLSVVRPLLPIGAVAGWVELLAVVAVIAVFYSLATQRGRNATAGELLLGTSYLTHGAEELGGVSLKRMLKAALERNAVAQPADLVRMSAIFRSLADTQRLRVARLLLEREQSADEVSSQLGLSPTEAAESLRELEEAGLVVAGSGEAAGRYVIADDHLKVGLAEFLTHVAPEQPPLSG